MTSNQARHIRLLCYEIYQKDGQQAVENLCKDIESQIGIYIPWEYCNGCESLEPCIPGLVENDLPECLVCGSTATI